MPPNRAQYGNTWSSRFRLRFLGTEWAWVETRRLTRVRGLCDMRSRGAGAVEITAKKPHHTRLHDNIRDRKTPVNIIGIRKHAFIAFPCSDFHPD